jgi:Ferredoxin-thioredoxin reductase, catalytic subunit
METQIANLRLLMEAWAELNDCQLNPDERRVSILLKYMLLRDSGYGEFYCPSQQVLGDPYIDNTIVCPCVYSKDDIVVHGSCGCGLFFKKEDLSEETR